MTTDNCPTLTPKARLPVRSDSRKLLLLYPERGLILNSTACEILRLCTGAQTVGMIVDQLRHHASRCVTRVADPGRLRLSSQIGRYGVAPRAGMMTREHER